MEGWRNVRGREEKGGRDGKKAEGLHGKGRGGQEEGHPPLFLASQGVVAYVVALVIIQASGGRSLNVQVKTKPNQNKVKTKPNQNKVKTKPNQTKVKNQTKTKLKPNQTKKS